MLEPCLQDRILPPALLRKMVQEFLRLVPRGHEVRIFTSIDPSCWTLIQVLLQEKFRLDTDEKIRMIRVEM